MRWVENSSKDLLVTSGLIQSYASQNNWLPSSEGVSHGPKLLAGQAQLLLSLVYFAHSLPEGIQSLKKSTLIFPPQPTQKLGKQLVPQTANYSLIQVHHTVTIFGGPK